MIEVRYYWLGLYKLTASRGSSSYWYATRWYDGSLSAYRWWADGFPRYRYETCVYFTIDGWYDASCDSEFYFVGKKPAGNSTRIDLSQFLKCFISNSVYVFVLYCENFTFIVLILRVAISAHCALSYCSNVRTFIIHLFVYCFIDLNK